MKKIVFLMMAWMGALMMQADDNYPYLTFETTDGTKTSVDVSSLPVTINLDNSTLTIGNQTFALADLSKMYFSTADETTTGISEELSVKSDEFATATFYDLQGHKVSKDQLRKGVYIVKTQSRTYKLVVK